MSATGLCLVLALGTGLVQDPAPEPAASEALPAAPPGSAASGSPNADPGVRAVPYTAYEPTAPPAVQPRRLVVAFLPSLTMGIHPVPSANLALFVGGRLPRGPWALGYQFTFSSGYAERYSRGWLTHRHHITALRGFARRGFAGVGGGAAFMEVSPVVEVEGRVGVRFGRKRYGVVAGQIRLGWDVGHRERAPMPQFGVVIGFAVM